MAQRGSQPPRHSAGLRRVAAFETDVREGKASPEQLETLLADVLHDPTVQLLFWLPASEVYADVEGSVVTAPEDDRDRTEAVLHGAPLALLLHGPLPQEGRELLKSVLDAASLTIEVARLRVEVKAQLAQVAASR